MGDSEITVKTQFGDVVIHKMPLSDYASILKALDGLPKTIQTYFKDFDEEKLKSTSNADYVAMLPGFLAESWDELVSLIAVPTDKDAKFIGQLDLADAVDIVGAILELNDLPRIAAAIKKMLALKVKIAKPQKQT